VVWYDVVWCGVVWYGDRERLWHQAWSAVRACACFESPAAELPTHLLKHLRDLYSGGGDAEFRYSHNVQSLLQLVVLLARPRLPVSAAATAAAGAGDWGVQCVSPAGLSGEDEGGGGRAVFGAGRVAEGQLQVMMLLCWCWYAGSCIGAGVGVSLSATIVAANAMSVM
jgi:hypothetical protein